MLKFQGAMFILAVFAGVSINAQENNNVNIAQDTVMIDSLVNAEDTLSDNEENHAIAGGQNKKPSREFIEIASDSSWWYREIENKAFGLGERLEFSVRYGKLPAGTAILEIPGIIDYDGHDCYRVVSIAHSNDVVSVFYKVRDTVETVIDVNGIFPRKFWKKLKEGGYHAEKTTIFDQKNHLAITDNDTIPTYTFVQDAFSSLYYARTHELIPGQDIFIDNHTSKKNYPLKLKVLKKEEIKVPAGKFKCVVVEPVMRAEGIFKAKGRIWIWLTDDQFKIPVMMKTEVFFLGSVSAQLKEYSLGAVSDEVDIE